MLKWSGKVKLICNSKHCLNALIFFQGPLKFSCAGRVILLIETRPSDFPEQRIPCVLNFPDASSEHRSGSSQSDGEVS